MIVGWSLLESTRLPAARQLNIMRTYHRFRIMDIGLIDVSSDKVAIA